MTYIKRFLRQNPITETERREVKRFLKKGIVLMDALTIVELGRMLDSKKAA